MLYWTCFLTQGITSTSTPVNYYIQTLDGFNNNFDIVEAKSVYMLSPTGLCAGLNGDIFVSDADRHLVFRIFNMWTSVEVYAGYVTNGFNGDGLKAVGTLLNGPSALSVNPLNGDLFIADSANGLIRIVSNRTRTTTSIPHTFNNPRGIYISSNGFAYISDTDNNLIKKYEIATKQISIIGGGGYLDGSYDGVDAKLLKLQAPKNIFVVSSGKKDVIYFTDTERLKSIDENGIYRIVDGGTAQSNLYGIFVSNGGEIYTSSQSNNLVQMKLLNSDETKISVGGTEGYDGDNQLYDSGIIKFYEPSSLIVSQNSIIVADKSNACIRKIDLQSKMVSTLAGGLVNHPYGEGISPLKMYSQSTSLPTIAFPFYYKNDFYFVERSNILRKVSNGKMTTILGQDQSQTLKYTANLPQRTRFIFYNIAYIGNGDVLLCNNEGGYYNYNLETQNLTLAYKTSYLYYSMAVVGDSYENSTIYIIEAFKIQVLQKSTIVTTLTVPNRNVNYQMNAIPNLRYPDSNSLLLFANANNILYELVHFKNGSILNLEIPIPAPITYFLTGFSVNTNTSLLFWANSQIYDFQLETYSFKKIGGLDYFNYSNSIIQIYGFNGDNIPIESSALYFPTAYRYGSKILVANTNYLSQISDGKITTIAGINPNAQTSAPLVLMRDPLKKVTYFIDTRTVKKFDESTGKSISISTGLQLSAVAVLVKTSYLTLTLQQIAAGRNFGLFSKVDRKLYIKDGCRIIRMDPETFNFETVIGTTVCGPFISGVKGLESPCPTLSLFYGMTIDDTNGDLLLATDAIIYRYNILTQFISTEFTFTRSGVISPDGIISNQTNIGTLSNIHYQYGHLYLITSSNIKIIEKLSNNTYYLRTLVGNSNIGYSGDKLPALESSLDTPWAIYVKRNGDIIILDGTGTVIVRMYQKQSGLLVDIAGSRAVNAKFNGDGFGTYSVFTSFTKQVDYDEATGEIFLIDARSYIRKVIPYCSRNYTFNSWNNTCDSQLSCNGTLATSSNACNGNGICSGFDICQCKDGFEGNFCEIQKITTDSAGVLIAAIVVPVVGSLLILLVIIVLVIVIVLCVAKKKKAFDIAQLDMKDIELSETTFLSTSSMIISSSAGSSIGSDVVNPFAKYSNIVRIGSGAFGAVYKVTDLKNNKLKAIKTVKFETLTDLNTIMKEASQLSYIKHPNIIKINDYFITNDNLLIMDMDYYELGDLTKLKHENCNEKIIKQILKQMLNALKYVHEEMQIIHRDIKPTNIFIKKMSSDNIEIVLADFGLAKKYQEMTGQSYAGTPLYMSPEVALGSAYSYNTDIFSLGVSLYQIMTNDLSISISNLLMGNQAENASKILTNQMKETHSEYSDELIQTVLKMLEKDANQRPSASQSLSLKYFK